jgi:hypothetical protein
MTNKEELVKIIGDFVSNGLNMDRYNTFECNLFMKDLNEFINVNSHFNGHYSGNKILIESVFFEPLISVELDKTTIHCIPVNDEGWVDAVFEVLKFIHIRESERKSNEQERKKQEEKDNKQFDWL